MVWESPYLQFFTFGAVVAALMKMVKIDLHTYAWMIISVAIIKALNLLPKTLEEACAGWYKFVAHNFTAALLLGIGIAYTSLGDVISAFKATYMLLVILTVLGAIVGGAVVGKMVGFYPIEAAITAGLCMANMGGRRRRGADCSEADGTHALCANCISVGRRLYHSLGFFLGSYLFG